jgi:hypothetical protein
VHSEARADRQPGISRTIGRLAFGVDGSIASTVYGTVVVMATVTVGYAAEKHPWKLAVLVSTTAVVLWVAHLYAHSLSERIALGHRLGRSEYASIAGREIGILLAAAAPTLALLLGAAGVVKETTAIWLVLVIGMVTLAAEGFRYARLERFGAMGTLTAIAGNLALGLFVVVLKALVAH